MKEILLIKTDGCSACACMEHILSSLQEDLANSFKLTIYTYPHVPHYILTNVLLTDFPVTVLVKDDVIKYHFAGTKSKRNIKQIIDDINF